MQCFNNDRLMGLLKKSRSNILVVADEWLGLFEELVGASYSIVFPY